MVWKDRKNSCTRNTKKGKVGGVEFALPSVSQRDVASLPIMPRCSTPWWKGCPAAPAAPSHRPKLSKEMKTELRGLRRAGFCLSPKLLPSISSSSSVVPLPSRLDSINILRQGVNVVEVQWSDTRGSAAVIANQPTVLSPAAAAFSWSLISPPFWWRSFSLSPFLWPSATLSPSLSRSLSHANLMNPAQMKCGRTLAGPKRSVSRRRDGGGEKEEEEESDY